MAALFPATSRMATGVIAGLCLAAVVSLPGHAQETRSANRIIDADGFRVNGKPATRNLPVDGTMMLTGKRGDEILLSCVQEKTTTQWLYVCAEDACEVSACAAGGKGVRRREWSFKSERKPQGGLERWLQALMTRDPKPAAVAAARAMGGPADSVVLLDEKGVHWAPALTGILEGSYCLSLGTLPPSAQTWTTELKWDRSRDPEGLATARGLEPGLYSLRKGPAAGPGCRPDPNEDAGWVLIVSRPRFSEIDAEWRSYAASVDELEGSGVSPSLLATLRRAALAGLAEP